MIEPFVADPDFTLYLGGASEVLAELPAESVHCVVTSPPYWALRDYGVDGQLGLEASPEEYVDAMVGVFDEVYRVLRPDGTLWLNIGDSYAAKTRGSDAGWDKSRLTNPGRVQKAQAASLRKTGERHRGQSAGVKEKELIGIPWRLAFALSDAGWWRRAEIIWDKANAMPESVEDRPSRAHEQVFLFAKSLRYFYDFVSVRQTALRERSGNSERFVPPADHVITTSHPGNRGRSVPWEGARRNLRSVWKVASQPYDGAHFAVFPPDLVEPCILAGTSAHGCCSSCGAPWLPVNEKRSLARHELPHDHPEYRPTRYVGKHDEVNGGGQRYLDVVTVDWTPSCDCAAGVAPCVVLDPFMGAGTTALVARAHGRRSIGVELNPEYARLAADRLSQLSLLVEGAA